MYLGQSLDAVEFDMRDGLPAAFGYETTKDKFLYDPKHPAFGIYDLGIALTHELSHRIDKFFVRSWKDKKFAKAIRAAEKIVDADPDMFVRFCTEKDEEGFCSDVLSAISKGKYKFPMGHGSNYWRVYTQAREIFANLYSLQTYQDVEKLEFLRSHFPELVARFEALDFYIA